jgi:tetratricopeptide (TPR) repeat protein
MWDRLLWDRCWLIMSLAELGRFAEAVEVETEAIRLAASTHHAFTDGLTGWAAAEVQLLKGDWPKARTRFKHAIAVVRRGNLANLLSPLLASSAWVLAQSGEANEALIRFRECEQLVE